MATGSGGIPMLAKKFTNSMIDDDAAAAAGKITHTIMSRGDIKNPRNQERKTSGRKR